MTEKPRPIRLGSETHKQFVASLILETPTGYFVTISPPKRGLKQNAAIHAKLTDISEQLAWPPAKEGERPAARNRWSVLVWKRLTMAAWLREEGHEPLLVPALDGDGVDIIFERTSELTVSEASRYLEWITAFGIQNGVKFNDQA